MSADPVADILDQHDAVLAIQGVNPDGMMRLQLTTRIEERLWTARFAVTRELVADEHAFSSYLQMLIDRARSLDEQP